MIKVKVVKADNPDYLGDYEFNKNLIYVGSNHEADLYFPESDLSFNHIFIEIVEDKLITHIHQDIEYINVNGKRTTNFKILKLHDTIEIHGIRFAITDFKITEYKTRKQDVLYDSCFKYDHNITRVLEPILRIQ